MLGMLDQVVEQCARIARQVFGGEGDGLGHLLDGVGDDDVEQRLLVGVVDVQQPLVGLCCRADPIDAGTGEPMLRELRIRGVEQPLLGGRGVGRHPMSVEVVRH
ncbi:Uncharacterised protein [Mycobacteroides abscessus subsp. abscessus]|nr:Uncharacterised protein [Mycobacteroides abscessus subsp. abscessus]